jgi:hypothetical protein
MAIANVNAKDGPLVMAKFPNPAASAVLCDN